MCALFDLLSCGLPRKANEYSSINAIKQFKQAIQELERSS
jgi:hypothetical protein